jgi:ribosomal protein S12 methylthiotransferase accessory factor
VDGEPSDVVDLAGPYGVSDTPRRVDTRGWAPPGTSVYIARLRDTGRWRASDGAGRTFKDSTQAQRIAIYEALERYASIHARPAAPVVATGRELGDRALPLTEVARCSPAELRHPDFPLVPPSVDARIRWSECIELTSGEPRLLPLRMTHMLPSASRDEEFWMQISTGCAIHRTQLAALLAGLYEVVERDAIAVAWLRKLPLPRLDPAAAGAEVDEISAWYRDRHITVHLFDATTDLPIPSVLCVVESPYDQRVAQVIGSATGFDLRATTLKAVLEATLLYAALAERTRLPRRYRDVVEPVVNSAYMARASRRPAFSFLLDGAEDRPLSLPVGRGFASTEQELGYVLDLFRTRGMAVYATDLTPREVEAIGCTVVSVVVPALQPASLKPLVQYRAHPRLRHDHPAATGAQRVRDLNRWPLPLA